MKEIQIHPTASLLGENLTVEDILRDATPRIEVVAILRSGEKFARQILEKLEGRAALFGINPHDLTNVFALTPGDDLKTLYPQNSLVICDDWIQGGITFRGIRDYLRNRYGYQFEKDDPLHYGVIDCVYIVGRFNNQHYTERNQIRLVRNFKV